MPRVGVYNLEGQQVAEIDLSERVFGAEVNEAVLHQAVVKHLAGQRRGTVATKGRSQIRGGGRKPWRQKGTGRARAGSRRSPLWRGGAVTFGPQARDYSYNLPRKVRRLALCSALSAKVKEGKLIIVENLALPEPKTKIMVQALRALGVEGKALVVAGEGEENGAKSVRNIQGVKPVSPAGLNVYDLLAHDRLLMTRSSISQVEEVLAN